MREYKNPDRVVEMVREEGVLLCGVSGCPAALASPLVPLANGWKLQHGWWLCSEHIEGGVDDHV